MWPLFCSSQTEPSELTSGYTSEDSDFSVSEIDSYTVVWYGQIGPINTSLIFEWLLLSPLLCKCSVDNCCHMLMWLSMVVRSENKIGCNHPSYYFPPFISFLPLLPRYFLNIRGLLSMFSLGLRMLIIQDHNFIISLGYHFREYTDMWVAMSMMTRAWFRYLKIEVMKQTMWAITRDRCSFQRHLLELLLATSFFSYYWS